MSLWTTGIPHLEFVPTTSELGSQALRYRKSVARGAIEPSRVFAFRKCMSLAARRRPSPHAVVPVSAATAARGAGGGGAGAVPEPELSGSRGGGAAGPAAEGLAERLTGGAGSAGTAAPWGGRSRPQAFTPCVRAEPGPCEPPT
jgi:hypothetical protein